MKRFLLVALAALMSIASASAQNTSITVTKVYSDVTQTPLASFRFCLTPVGASGQPQAFTSSGGGQVSLGFGATPEPMVQSPESPSLTRPWRLPQVWGTWCRFRPSMV